MRRVVLLCIICQLGVAQSDSVHIVPDWIAGSWRMERGSTIITEAWSSVKNGRLTGVGRTMVNGKVTEQEMMSIEREPSGVLVFNAKPERQNGATFTLAASGDSTITFVNLKHDFPQRIQYRRLSADSLAATIVGTVNGKNRIIEFRYRRVVIEAD